MVRKERLVNPRREDAQRKVPQRAGSSLQKDRGDQADSDRCDSLPGSDTSKRLEAHYGLSNPGTTIGTSPESCTGKQSQPTPLIPVLALGATTDPRRSG